MGYTEKSLARLAEGTGRVLIASSRASEFSLVFDGARNSLFTEHLLNALRGGARTRGDGLIRVFEVFNHVAEQVRAAAPGQQHPIFKASNLEDNFPIALECGGTKTLTGPVGLNGDREIWRQLEEIFAISTLPGRRIRIFGYVQVGIFPAFALRALGAQTGLQHCELCDEEVGGLVSTKPHSLRRH